MEAQGSAEMLGWWRKDAYREDLEKALDHANESRRLGSDRADALSHCELIFKALNALWTGWRRAANQLNSSDGEAFRGLVSAVAPERRVRLCASRRVREFAQFEPQIMDQHMLQTSRRYRPPNPIPESLAKDARRSHKRLVVALSEFDAGRTDESERLLLDRLADLLYIVRSNLAHGEKTRHGPDLDNRNRDLAVSGVTLQAAQAVLDAVLEEPSTRLAAYGTLAPGGVNYDLLAALPGEWRKGAVRGLVREHSGLPTLQWTTAGEPVAVSVLSSPELESRWGELDRFEGDRYDRLLVPVEFDREVAVANAYLDAGVDRG